MVYGYKDISVRKGNISFPLLIRTRQNWCILLKIVKPVPAILIKNYKIILKTMARTLKYATRLYKEEKNLAVMGYNNKKIIYTDV